MRVVVLDDYQSVAMSVADWTPVHQFAEVDVVTAPFDSPRLLVAALRPYEVIVAMRERTRFPRSILEQLPNLRLLVTTGQSNPAIDLRACEDLGISVSATGPSAGATAELTWALILNAAKRLDLELASVRAGGWMIGLGWGLRGRTLGVLGLGRVGGEVAKVGLAFGMNVVSWSENLTEARCAEVGVRRVARDELFSSSDVVSVHLVLSDRTRGLVGEPELRAMKTTAWLVNTSRGPICDESALLRACQEGWIGGAALDVYDQEPLPRTHPLRRVPNVLATPHIGYVTRETYAAWFTDVVEDIVAFGRGGAIRSLVRADNRSAVEKQ
jgi:phosphoglycerate dehydrogenase-like enzyme